MGGRTASSLLLGLLCLLSGALLPGEAQEETSRLPADSRVTTTSPLLVSSADLPDLSVSSSVSGRQDATSQAPANEIITETERPSPPLSPTVSAAESDDARSNVTAALGNVTEASDEMASNPSKISPVTDNNDTTSADATQPPSAVNIVTADTTTEMPSLLATLRTSVAAKTQLSDDFTPHTITSMSFPSTWMSAITTSLFITTTMTSPGPSSPATQSSTAAPHTTRPEVQRGPSVLEVGDEKDLTSYHSGNSSNPMFVMIVSVFTIMVVMVVVVVGFHRYKKRNSRTEFRRLQDLPMDDMMEDTPLSLYSY